MTDDIALRLAAATGELSTAAVRLMEEGLPWYRALGAQERSWVGLVAQAGIQGFIDWYADPTRSGALTADVFGAAPSELTRVISLEQTVALVRTTIGVVESAVDELGGRDAALLREAILVYSREIAFSAAEVYARAAEARGAWDARLEALVVDALLRDELDDSLMGRMAALGWRGSGSMVVLAGTAQESTPAVLRVAAGTHGLDLLAGVEGPLLIAVVGGIDATEESVERVARTLSPHFAEGPVVHSALLRSLDDLGAAAREVLVALRAAVGWPDAPRPSRADDFLPERALAGDQVAIDRLVADVYAPLAADPALLATAEGLLERQGTIEGAARGLFVHPNTVRYRIRRIAELTGCSLTDTRDAYVVRIALTLGRLHPDLL